MFLAHAEVMRRSAIGDSCCFTESWYVLLMFLFDACSLVYFYAGYVVHGNISPHVVRPSTEGYGR